MTGFQTRLAQDLPPFVTAAGNPAQAQGINQEGLRRRGYTPERIAVVKQIHRSLYRKGLTLAAAITEIGSLRGVDSAADVDIDAMLAFLSSAERGIVR
jgi:UDP-N-acetylglucosamine acyltransferase